MKIIEAKISLVWILFAWRRYNLHEIFLGSSFQFGIHSLDGDKTHASLAEYFGIDDTWKVVYYKIVYYCWIRQ